MTLPPKTTHPPYSVFIIGAGNIAALQDTPHSSNIITHAHAIQAHPSFRLLGFAEPDPNTRQIATERWSVPSYQSVEDWISSTTTQHKADVIAIAAPTQEHFPLLVKLIDWYDENKEERPFHLIFCEKPLVADLAQAETILRHSQQKQVPICVNYSRRYLPRIQTLSQKIQSQDWGALLGGTASYGKGLFNNGSHLIDLLVYFFGPMEVKQTLTAVYDHFEFDPSISGVLQVHPQDSANTSAFIYLQTIDCRAYTHFELDLFFERGRIKLTDLSTQIIEYTVQESSLYSGYRQLASCQTEETQIQSAMSFAYNHLASYLPSCSPFPSQSHALKLINPIEETLAVIQTCDKIYQSARDNNLLDNNVPKAAAITEHKTC
ncbi:MAG: Gfo/Idh/MocA family oxidoreductase [Cyanobacteria bacterium]|nr:Gfo/Idh/MocA family oxidoreductase [Cyanobacteriota bacterium]